MPKLPSMRALQAFEAFGRLGSVTAAAQELCVTIGAVSQQLRKAEAEVGLRLIERNGNSVSLTARGRLYHAEVQAAFDTLRDAQARVERSRSAEVLSISCLPSVASKWLGAQLLDWQRSNPSVTVRLVGDDAEPVLGGGDVDFRLTYGQLARRHDHRTELFTDWVVPACAPVLRDRLTLNEPADILAAPLLGIEWASAQGRAPGWDDWTALIGVTRSRVAGEVAFSQSGAAIDAAINGRGFVLAQLSMAREDIEAGRLVVPFDLRLKLDTAYVLAWDPAALETPYGLNFKRWLQSIARRQNERSRPLDH